LIELTDEIREALSKALSDRAPVVVSYVDAGGQPHLSFRGTAQVLNKEQLAIWVRNPEGGIVGAVAHNPRIALLYRNAETRLSWQFLGRGAIVDDPTVRATVYDHSPEVERNQDPERKGKALVIDVDQVIQRGQVVMRR